MASEWFMRRDGQEDGPFSSQQLKHMARNGLLAADDLVWKEGMPDWRPAGESRRLFPGLKKRSSKRPASQVVPVAPPVTRRLAGLALPRGRRARIALVAGGVSGLLLLVLGGVLISMPALDTTSNDPPKPSAVAGSSKSGPTSPPRSSDNESPPRPPGAESAGTSASGQPVEAAVGGGGDPPVKPLSLPPGLEKIAEFTIAEVGRDAGRSQVSALALSADNRYLAVGLGDGRLVVIEATVGGRVRRTVRAHPGGDRASPVADATTSISFSPSDGRVGWGTMFRHFAIADPADGEVVWQSPVMAKGLKADLDPPQVVLKDDDTMLVATLSGVSELSTIDICRPLHGGTPWQGMGLDAVIGEPKMTFVAKSGQGIAGRGPGRWPIRSGNASRLVAISPDGTTGGLFVGDPSAPSLALFELGGDSLSTLTKDLPQKIGRDARLLISGSESGVFAMEAQLLAVSSDAAVRRVELVPASAPTMVGIDNERRRAVVGRVDGGLCLIDLGAAGQSQPSIQARLQVAAPSGACGAISPDGSRLAVSGAGTVLLLEITGKATTP
jgi:hypothetical protein